MAQKDTWKGKGPDLDGTSDADILLGDNRANVIRGLDGNDYIYGGNRNDTLDGGAGNDLIAGAQGADIMTGGAGSDTFRFVNLYDWTDWSGTAPVGMDTITDLSAEDFLDFSRVSSGAITSFSQFSFEAVDGGMVMHVDAGGLETNDMHVLLLGVSEAPVESQFILA